VGRDVSVIVLDNMLAAYYGGKQIALHKLSDRKKEMVVNQEHYKRMLIKQSFDIENTLLFNPSLVDHAVTHHDLSIYDAAIGGDF
jgi:hypothetical protein